MFAFIQLIIVICPFVPLVYVIKELDNLCKVLNQNRCIKEKHISFKGIKDFFPKNIRQELGSDSGIEKKDIDEVLNAYRKLVFSFYVYVLFWILYLIGIAVRVGWLFNNHCELHKPQEYGSVIGSILTSILILYWLFLTPLFEFIHWKKLSELGYLTWKFLQDILYKISEKFKQITTYICKLGLSLVALNVYTLFVKKILISVRIDLTFRSALLMLMFYQYILLDLVSRIVKCIKMRVIKSESKCLKKYGDSKLIYLMLKNDTYLSMVVIYAVAVYMNKSEIPLIAAMGVLFLFDTFWAQENVIQEKMKSNLGDE